MHSKHPADELADLRAEIRRLKDREAALRARLLAAPPADPVGRWARLDIVTERRRHLLTDRLPDAIRDDPRYWAEREVISLRCDPVGWAMRPRSGWPIRRQWDGPEVLSRH